MSKYARFSNTFQQNELRKIKDTYNSKWQNHNLLFTFICYFIFFILNLHRSVRVTPLLPRKKETHWSALFITFYIYIVTLLRKEQIFINFSAMKQFNIIPFKLKDSIFTPQWITLLANGWQIFLSLFASFCMCFLSIFIWQ